MKKEVTNICRYAADVVLSDNRRPNAVVIVTETLDPRVWNSGTVLSRLQNLSEEGVEIYISVLKKPDDSYSCNIDEYLSSMGIKASVLFNTGEGNRPLNGLRFVVADDLYGAVLTSDGNGVTIYPCGLPDDVVKETIRALALFVNNEEV